MSLIEISEENIEKTLSFLKCASNIECVVLWLGKRDCDVIKVHTVYLPKQLADYDYFHIPEESMAKLLKFLRQNRLMVAAQVHTHPDIAFHSAADDRWAIIRHIGGLSLVVPHFATTTSLENFITNTAVFKFNERNIWEAVPKNLIQHHYKVIT